jgi:D-alanyl-D-alanine carboxypeptidase
MKSVMLSILVLVLVAGCSVNTPQVDLTPVLNQLVEENEIPGINFSMITADGSHYDFTAGYADTASHDPMTADHVMFSGSIGKTYCAAIILQLVDEGELSLTDTLRDYFPDDHWMDRLANINDLTVQMILEHRTGLPRYAMLPAVWDTMATNPDKVWSYRDRLEIVFDMEAEHGPGEAWGYSDTNYLLLGMLIEVVTGNPYYDEVRARLLTPYQLDSTHPALHRDIPNLSNGYSTLPEMFRIPGEVVFDGQYVFNPQMEWTGGGMASTAHDLAAWASVYFDSDLISDELKTQMVTECEHGYLGEDDSYGMGAFIFRTAHGEAYGHTGFMPGFNSAFMYYPDHDLAVAMQINCDYASQKMGMLKYLDRIVSEVVSEQGDE